MAETNINSSVASDLTNAISPYVVPSETTDGAGNSKEFEWTNPYWSEDYGYYLTIPEFKRAVDTKTLWTLGAGFEADDTTVLLLDSIKGNAKDSFNSILKNQIKTKTITGDSFAEVIRDGKGVLANLKPLDPSSIRVVQNRQGRIVRYEQVSKNKKSKKTFTPEQIFHLSHERIADEIHGTRIIQSLKWLIDARNEAMSDWRIVLRRNVRPVRLWFLDTDDPVEIAGFKATTDAAYGNTENLYIPKGTVETEIASVAPNATMNPLPWIEMIKDQFFQAVGVPQIIFGNAKGFTDASGKIVYLAFEQNVKEEQLYIEEQVLGQLNLEISLTFPASLQNELISSNEKDPNSLEPVEPNDQQVELEGPK